MGQTFSYHIIIHAFLHLLLGLSICGPSFLCVPHLILISSAFAFWFLESNFSTVNTKYRSNIYIFILFHLQSGFFCQIMNFFIYYKTSVYTYTFVRKDNFGATTAPTTLEINILSKLLTVRLYLINMYNFSDKISVYFFYWNLHVVLLDVFMPKHFLYCKKV